MLVACLLPKSVACVHLHRGVSALHIPTLKMSSSPPCLPCHIQAAFILTGKIVHAETASEVNLLSPFEVQEAIQSHIKLMRCLSNLPDIRTSQPTLQIWRNNTLAMVQLVQMCISSCFWASQHDVDRRLVQTLAASIQVESQPCLYQNFCTEL